MKKTILKTLNEHFPLNRAKRCIALYKLFMQDKLKVPEADIVKAFTLHADELLDAIGIPEDARSKIKCKYEHVRVYVGMNDEATGGEKPSDFKLFLVPVEGIVDGYNGGKDVIPHKKKSQNDEGEDEYVYDLIAPCPNTCDTDSPLFKARYVKD
jgi:hypothetical protein